MVCAHLPITEETCSTSLTDRWLLTVTPSVLIEETRGMLSNGFGNCTWRRRVLSTNTISTDFLRLSFRLFRCTTTNCDFSLLQNKNQKYGAEPNLRPPGAPSPTGNTIYGASRTCKNLRGQRPLGAEIQSPEKSPVEWVNMPAYNFFVSGPKFTKIFFAQQGMKCV